MEVGGSRYGRGRYQQILRDLSLLVRYQLRPSSLFRVHYKWTFLIPSWRVLQNSSLPLFNGRLFVLIYLNIDQISELV